MCPSHLTEILKSYERQYKWDINFCVKGLLLLFIVFFFVFFFLFLFFCFVFFLFFFFFFFFFFLGGGFFRECFLASKCSVSQEGNISVSCRDIVF